MVGVSNPAFGNTAANSDQPAPPPPAHQPIPAPPNQAPVTPSTPQSPALADTADSGPTLAHTGADGLGWAAGGSVALLLGGTVLYRRARPAARR